MTDGYELETVRRRVEKRAGVHRSSGVGPGPMRGNLDVCCAGRIAGWAQDLLHQDAPVCLAILLDGVQLAELVANRWRRDLAEAGIGKGRHAFDYHPSTPIPEDKLNTIQVVRSSDRTAMQQYRPTLAA